jgi:hypothetical protein
LKPAPCPVPRSASCCAPRTIHGRPGGRTRNFSSSPKAFLRGFGLLLAILLAAPALAAAPDSAPVLSLAGIERLDGSVTADQGDTRRFLQAFDEMRRIYGTPSAWPDPRARGFGRTGSPRQIAIGLLDLPYSETGPDGRREALLRAPDARSGPLQRAFVMAPLVARTLRGASVTFRLDPREVVSDWRGRAPRIEFDADDGRGFRPLAVGGTLEVAYAWTGIRTLRLRAIGADGATRLATARFEVAGLVVPDPDDTLHVTGASYAGGTASGEGYVRLADGHTSITQPVVVVEGFDLDNSLDWDGLYEQLSQQDLLETLRGEGFDLIVLNFDDATDYVQRNAFVLVDLIDQVRAIAPPGQTIALVGASMGGLVGRYALAWMESQGMPHDVRTFIAFDSPQRGANIPLGIQYWFNFFAGQSVDAAQLRDILNSPAARQMLVYHFKEPATSTGAPDPLRGTMDAELATLGYPTQCRNVAVANGSGIGLSQGFDPGEPIVQWDYDIVIIVIHGNVWAVPNGTNTQIFQGRQYALFSLNQTLNVSVSGTAPYDGAPGGSRNSMQQMDETAAPYGDIVALFASHCFIPTVSAVDFATADLFHDIVNDPALATSTPFDAVYLPDSNQAHVTITPQNAVWLTNEIEAGAVAVAPPAAPAGLTLAAGPNPFTDATRVHFTLSSREPVDLAVYAIDGRRVATLASGTFDPGVHALIWNGRDTSGHAVRPSVYFIRLEVDRAVRTIRVARLH